MITLYDKNKQVLNNKKIYKGVYSINFENNKRYIGISNNIKNRLKEHSTAVKNEEDLLPVHKAMRKYNYWVELIEEVNGSRKELCEREKYYIKLYNTFGDDGYNLTPAEMVVQKVFLILRRN